MFSRLNKRQDRRPDRTVWYHKPMPLPVTFDPLECKNLIGLLNGTNKENNEQFIL